VFKINLKKILKCEKGKVRSAFQDFRVRGFVIFIAKHPTYNNSGIAKKKGTNISGFQGLGFQKPKSNKQALLNFEKVKGCGTNTSGFWDSGF
jgi:hypothetical protein